MENNKKQDIYTRMAYLYRHIRLDKNEPFYIGIGSDSEGKYTRAFSKHKRNRHWYNIVNKSDYEIEIMLDELTWEEACEKEKEFIKLYGRRDFNEGTLVNMTQGGEGIINLSQESRNKMSSFRRSFEISEETRNKMRYNSKGERNPNYGKKHSTEIKSICSKAAKTQKSNIKGTTEYDKARFLRSNKLKGEGNPCYDKFGKEHPAFGYEGYWKGKSNHPRKAKVEYEGIIYSSKTELAKHLKVSKSLITKMIKKQKVKELTNS